MLIIVCVLKSGRRPTKIIRRRASANAVSTWQASLLSNFIYQQADGGRAAGGHKPTIRRRRRAAAR